MSGDCCHYDEGYEDGFEDGKKAQLPSAHNLAPLEVAELLLRVSRQLYASDALNLTALDCERTAYAIAAESDTPGAVQHLRAS